MKTIVISISRGSLIRNFFRSNVVQGLLDKGYRIVIATPNHESKELFDEFKHPQFFIEPLLAPKRVRFESLIREVAKASIFNTTIHARYKYRFSGEEPNKRLYYPRLMLSIIRYIPGIKRCIRLLDSFINPQYEHDELLKKYAPSLIFITTTHEYAESGLVKSAKRLGIPTAGMPKSWDNLSKTLFLTKNDTLLVWSPYMKRQALRYQCYRDKEVVVTGAPQFDYYAYPENRISREAFCERLGLNPNKKIILYGSTGGNCFDEGAYVGLIQQWLTERAFGDAQILMRPHLGYHNDAEKFKKYISQDCVLDTHDKQNMKFKDLWDPSEEHLKHLYNSMYHADVCINIASTLTLDAAAASTPVINVNFDVDESLPMSKSTKRLYTTDYINAVTHTNGTWLVESRDSFKRALQEILCEKARKDQEHVLIEEFIFKNDGNAAERIIAVLSALAEKELNTMKEGEKSISAYSTRELRMICQGSAPNPARESWIGWSSRMFSIYFTRFFIKVGMQATQICALGAFTFFVGISLYIYNDYYVNFLAMFLVYLSIIFDCCDGEVARFRKKAGVLGSMYNEPVSHDTMYGLMFLPIGLGVWLSGGSPIFIALGALAGISKLLYRGLEIRFWILMHDRKSREEIVAMKESYSKKHVLVRLVYWLNKNLFSSTGVFLGMLICVPIYHLDWYLIFYGLGFFSLWVMLFAKQIYTIDHSNVV